MKHLLGVFTLILINACKSTTPPQPPEEIVGINPISGAVIHEEYDPTDYALQEPPEEQNDYSQIGQWKKDRDEQKLFEEWRRNIENDDVEQVLSGQAQIVLEPNYTVDYQTDQTDGGSIEELPPQEPEFVEFTFNKGPLQPEVTRLITTHFDNSPTVVWSIDKNHTLANTHTVRDKSYRHILHTINEAYKAKAVLYSNNIIEIVYR